MTVPEIRISRVNDAPVRPDREYVLYWMTAHRRTRYNAALERAVEHANELQRPLLVFEPLRVDYPWASDRHHRFVLDGMKDNAARLRRAAASHMAWVEPTPGSGRGLLAALARHAAVVVADDWPGFFLPRAVSAAGLQVDVAMEKVDACGLVPVSMPDRTFTTAHSFRRWFQKHAEPILSWWPQAEPLSRLNLRRPAPVPPRIRERWPGTASSVDDVDLADLPIDHDVAPTGLTGGNREGRRLLEDFIGRLADYAEGRNHPDDAGASGLSAHLHFGHIGTHEVVRTLLDHEDWEIGDLAETSTGARTGFWGCGPGAESFLDELVIWRELGLNMSAREPDHDRWESLPEWARRTLDEHAADPRPVVYDLETLEEAGTDDEIWNAAQRQLVREGRIHNYLRMLWGKKILEWSPSPQDALDVMIELNNRYALDGRDPNSYSGIFWVLGRYDRAWGPERPIYGKVRYMTSESTRKKLRLRDYLERFGPITA